MGIREKRNRQKEEFRIKIINAARELFIEKGYEAFSMRKLAHKIGFSPTTIYLYFKDKDALLFAMCEELAEQCLLELTKIRKQHIDPVKKLRKALLFHVKTGLENPDHYKVLFFVHPGIYGSQTEFMQRPSIARDTHLAFKDIVKECIDSKLFIKADPETVTEIFYVSIHGLIVMSIFKSNYPWTDREILGKTLVDSLIRAYLKQ